jgi:hypothetical protein
VVEERGRGAVPVTEERRRGATPGWSRGDREVAPAAEGRSFEHEKGGGARERGKLPGQKYMLRVGLLGRGPSRHLYSKAYFQALGQIETAILLRRCILMVSKGY